MHSMITAHCDTHATQKQDSDMCGPETKQPQHQRFAMLNNGILQNSASYQKISKRPKCNQLQNVCIS